MAERLTPDKLQRPVREVMRKDFIRLHPDLTVGQALDLILEQQPDGRIIYFYVVDDDGRLVGVVPTRRLLLSPRDNPLSQVLISPVITIPDDAIVLEACEFFVMHELLAFPVVDSERRLLGLVDVDQYTQELTDLDRRDGHNDLFQLIGVRLTEAQQRSASDSVRRRLPWLLATLVGGLLAALISDYWYDLASLPLVLPFIPLVLALSGSVTAQSVSVALQAIHSGGANWRSLGTKLRTEATVGALLGVACGLIGGGVVLTWKSDTAAALALFGSIAGGLASAAALGLAIPYTLWMIQRKPQVAAGPVALTVADAVALLVYFSLARWLLGGA